MYQDKNWVSAGVKYQENKEAKEIRNNTEHLHIYDVDYGLEKAFLTSAGYSFTYRPRKFVSYPMMPSGRWVCSECSIPSGIVDGAFCIFSTISCHSPVEAVSPSSIRVIVNISVDIILPPKPY